ncbi:MAG: hypothetical protein ACE5I3_02250 [Phycisphaerae bacterium]
MDFRNSTDLDDTRLCAMLLRHSAPYRHQRLTVRVRYSRGADFSGTCYYREARIHVNLGRHNRYPYNLRTSIAKARATRTGWRRELYRLTVADAHQLALFVYLHELFHYLVKKAGRSPRRKEAMCDRFAARVLVDHYNCPVRRRSGQLVPRESWDFKDLDAFVAAAPRDPQMRLPFCGPIPVTICGA